MPVRTQGWRWRSTRTTSSRGRSSAPCAERVYCAAEEIPMLARTLSRATLLLALTPVAGAAPANRAVFVSVVDEANKPVTNMAADEFRVREDQTDREIISVTPARDPLQVVVLVDTSDGAGEMTQDIRNAVGGFLQQIHSANPDASISLMEFGQAAVT